MKPDALRIGQILVVSNTHWDREFRRARLSRMDESAAGRLNAAGNKIALRMGAKKIVTLRVLMDGHKAGEGEEREQSV